MESSPILPVITFTIGVVFSIILGISSNLITPKVQFWLTQRSADIRSRSAKRLEGEITFITALCASGVLLNSWLFVCLTALILLVGTGLLFGIFTLISISVAAATYGKYIPIWEFNFIVALGIIMAASFLGAFYLFYRSIVIVTRVITIKTYLPAAQKRLEKLKPLPEEPKHPE